MSVFDLFIFHPKLLQCDGNLYDAISVAIKAALFNTKSVAYFFLPLKDVSLSDFSKLMEVSFRLGFPEFIYQPTRKEGRKSSCRMTHMTA